MPLSHLKQSTTEYRRRPNDLFYAQNVFVMHVQEGGGHITTEGGGGRIMSSSLGQKLYFKMIRGTFPYRGTSKEGGIGLFWGYDTHVFEICIIDGEGVI